MNFLVLFAACVAVAFAQYQPEAAPAPESYPPAPPQTYPAPAPGPYPGPYPEEHDDDHKPRGYRKLKNLHITGVVDARKRYFTRRDDVFVAISCPRNPTPSAYTWILADSRDTTPSFAPANTVTLAGGINVEYVAKLGSHGRWEGRDFFLDDKHRFRRVGCFQGTVPSGLP
ncbi:unnamed protein product [Caenorhabditis sp. 36 PRJEB53466]|nr:unnamed protein product [Caenorhabditis sp. 36 PRJEB53466]